MANPSKPRTKLDVQPGEDIWTAMARELSSHPDSPASLQIMSAVNSAMRPRNAAADQVVSALAEQLENPGPAAGAAVTAAVAHWERACDGPASESLLQQFRDKAQQLVADRRRGPPKIESVVTGVAGRPDAGYELGVHMHGLRGTWHRLWASISASRLWGESPEQQECVATVREQFETQLGRALTSEEWAQLTQHAHRHCDTVSKPMLAKWEESEKERQTGSDGGASREPKSP
jgi:hypothetical protein